MRKNKSVIALNNCESYFKKINENFGSKVNFEESVNSRLKYKSYLKNILTIIKNYQIEILTQISISKKNKKLSNKKVTQSLQDLKQELNSLFHIKTKNKINSEQNKNKTKTFFSQNISDRKDDNNSINQEEKNQVNNNKIEDELTHLKLLNFKIENQIKYIDTKIKLLSANIFIRKKHDKYIYLLLDNKNDLEQAYNLLHDKLISNRERFKIVVKQKRIQNDIMAELKEEVDLWRKEFNQKQKMNHNEYIDTNKIISEETSEYTKTTLFPKGTNDITNKRRFRTEPFEGIIFYENQLKCINNNNCI